MVRRPIDEAEALIIARVDAAIVQELDDGQEGKRGDGEEKRRE